MGKIIAIANQKGGVGKTTTAAALTDGLKQRGFTTLLVDLDAQGNLTYTAGANTDGLTSLDCIHGKASASQAIQKTAFGDFIASSPFLAVNDMYSTETGKDGNPRIKYGAHKKLKDALEPVRGNYDFIIIDCPPALGTLTTNALVAADSVIITAQADIYSLQGIGQLYKTIGEAQTQNKGLKIAGILLTRHSWRAILSRDLAELIAETAAMIKTKVYKAKIREGIAVKEAQASGQSVITYSPKSNQTKDYNDFIDEFLKDIRE